MVAFACLSIASPGKWLQPTDVAPIISALLYCSRLFSLLIHLDERKLWDPATLTLTPLYEDATAQAHAWEAFEDRQHATLSLRSDTIVPRLAMIGEWKQTDTEREAEEGPRKRLRAV